MTDIESGRRLSLTRGELLGGAAAGAGVALAAGLASGFPDTAASAPSPRQDVQILNFVLGIEDLQAAYYDAVLQRGRLSGERRDYARVVARHEHAHAAFLRKQLGSHAKHAGRYSFGDAVNDPQRFVKTARRLEDIAVRAYDAGAPSLTTDALAAAARIVSVEARHAAWIRDLGGLTPAPDAAEPTPSADQLQAEIHDLGFVR